MATAEKIFLRVEKKHVRWFKAHHARAVSAGSWLEVVGDVRPWALSEEFGALVVEWSISTSVDQIWVHSYVDGEDIRELLFNQGKWTIVTGTPFEFEDTRALKKLLNRKNLLASSDGYDVLQAFLGSDPSPEPVEAWQLHDSVTPREIAKARDAGAANGLAAEDRSGVLFRVTKSHVSPLRALGRAVAPGQWVPIENGASSQKLVHGLQSAVVLLTCSPAIPMISGCADAPDVPQHLLVFQEPLGGWVIKSGRPLPFQDGRALARLTAKKIFPDPDAFFAAFLGGTELSMPPLPRAQLRKLLTALEHPHVGLEEPSSKDRTGNASIRPKRRSRPVS